MTEAKIEEQQSIFEYIMSHVVDGELPEDFSLDGYDDDEQPIRFADGAWDGICIYHVAPPTYPDGFQQTLVQVLETACAGDFETADQMLLELTGEHRAVFLIDEFQSAVVDNAEGLDSQVLGDYMVHLVTTSVDKELFKLGLALLELYDEPGPDMKELVRTIGLSDEFTIFCLWNMRHWTNGNDELFSLARKVHGWGRVHAVEQLEPTTEEIRDWLLYEGIDNQVMPEYSALTCYRKAGVAERLEREIGHEEFSAITLIVDAGLNEGGPVAGIMALDDKESELFRYVRQAERQPLDLDDCECISKVAKIAEAWGWDDLAASCQALLES